MFNGEDNTGSLERRWVARVNVLKTNGIHETFTHQVYFVSKNNGSPFHTQLHIAQTIIVFTLFKI